MNLCFEAQAREGVLRLVLPDERGDAVAAALALAEHEALIVVLEQWLQQPLDPQPVARADAGPGLWWAEAGPVQIGMAWPLLAAQTRAPAWTLRWPDFPFEATVAAFDEAPRPADAQGGVLLLPPAFESAWRVNLHAPLKDLLAEAEWRGPGHELLLVNPPEPGAAPDAGWRVQLAEPLMRSLPELLGWIAPVTPWCPGDLAYLLGPDGSRHAGHIAPALGGFGLWLID